jgi:ABC-type nitrate/sulfonate/bicarbonate transport system substrate-binding protein
VLLKVNDVVDAAAVAEAWNAAARSRVQTGKSPVVVLLFGRELPPPHELRNAMASAALQRRPAAAPDELVVAVVNAGDWTCLTRDDVSTVVRKLLDRVCSVR